MREIDPAQTSRAQAFALWMDIPLPMVTLFKTIDVTNLVKISKKYHCKFNMLLCWCIGKAASQIKEFYTLPVGHKLVEYDQLAVNTVVATQSGGINTCDIPFSADLKRFNAEYLRLTAQVSCSGQPYDLGGEYMVIGTSALPQTYIDGAVNIYAGVFNNPFVVWGKYRKRWLKQHLSLSFQFHHTQMDGGEAAQFLELLQREIKSLRPY